jgi:membrane protein YqaA with SNARE-associated domain
MEKSLFKLRQNLRDWALRNAEGPHSKFWLSVVSFTEASFFPIPPDPFLIGILIAGKRKRWIYYSLLTTFFSVLGAVLGYLIGMFFFDTLGEWLIRTYNLSEEMAKVGLWYENNAFGAIFISAFTPIPFKIFTIAAGFFHINFFIFVIASIIGRAMRFLFVGWIFKVYGEKVAHLLFKHFNFLTFLMAVFFLVFLVYSFF